LTQYIAKVIKILKKILVKTCQIQNKVVHLYMKKKIKYKILQVIANYVIYMLKNAHNDDMFNYYFELGCKLDAYSIQFHDIHLA